MAPRKIVCIQIADALRVAHNNTVRTFDARIDEAMLGTSDFHARALANMAVGGQVEDLDGFIDDMLAGVRERFFEWVPHVEEQRAAGVEPLQRTSVSGRAAD